MNDRVQEILSWYGSDSPGTLANIARLLNHGRLGGTGKLVILPVDQGFEHGPARSFAANPAAYDPRYHFELAIEAGCNAYAAPLGFIEGGAREFAGRIPLILKLNNKDSLLEEKDPTQAWTGSVQDALRLGASAVGFTIYPGSSERFAMYERIPIATLAERVRHVVQSAFGGRRIVIFSGGEAKETDKILAEIRAIKDGGGFGSIVGRNSFQRPRAEGVALLRQIMDVYAAS